MTVPVIDPRRLAIVVPCCDRPDLSPRNTVDNILRGGFTSLGLHLSFEPGCEWRGQDWPAGCMMSRHAFKFGLMLHFWYCWKWIYETTNAEYLMLVENDVRFCPSAASRLKELMDAEAGNQLGFISLFTPATSTYTNNPEANSAHRTSLWVDQRAGYHASAGQCMCIRRDVLGAMMAKGDFLAIDWYIGRYCKDNDLPCWHAYPSMAEHVADYSARVGGIWKDHKGLNYDDNA